MHAVFPLEYRLHDLSVFDQSMIYSIIVRDTVLLIPRAAGYLVMRH